MDDREVGWDDIDWIDLAQDMEQWSNLVNIAINVLVSIKVMEIIECLHNWRLDEKGSAP
jgi:hypothetical protein